MTQSGAIGIAVVDGLRARGLGVSSFASVGNKADVSGNDLLTYWEQDSATRQIVLYLESFGNPRAFARIAPQTSLAKPVLAIKSGRSEVAAGAATSHTAALALPDDTVSALLRQSGVLRVDDVEEEGELIADVLVRLGELAELVPELVTLDINPLIVTPLGVCAVDVKVRLQETSAGESPGSAAHDDPTSHPDPLPCYHRPRRSTMDLNRHRAQLTDDRERLLAAQKVLEDEQGTTVDGRRTIDADDASPQDPAEIGEQFSGRREVLDELDHLDAELAAVTAALARLDTGTYGQCMDCGQPIDEERLVARPTVRRCTADQRRFEAGGTGLSRR